MTLRRILTLAALLCLLAWPPAYAQKTPAQIRTDINTLFPDNDQNRITPFDLRFVTTEITSAYLPVTSVIPSANIPPATNGGLGGVFAVACASNLWIQTITTGTGSPVCTQINFSNLAGSASAGQIAAAPASHAMPIDVAGTPTWSVIPNCLDSLGQHVNYTQSTDAWSCGTSTGAGPGVGSVDNLLPNVQWQVTTGVVPAVKQKSDGSGVQTGASCTSFQTVNGSPIFTCANTQQIKVGDIVVVATTTSFSTAAYDNFWGFTGAGYISCNAGTVQCQPTAGTTVSCTSTHNTCYVMPGLVTAVIANTSIAVQGYFGGVSPVSSSPTVLYPIIRGDTSGGTSVNCPDGWTKTASLISAQDDFSSHAYPGALRVLYMRGGITGTESCTYTVPGSAGTPGSSGNLARYQGQTVSFGVVANQTVQGGAGTWNISISDNTGTSTSSNGTGSGFGGYQFETVTRTIAQNATSVTFNLNKTGNANDVIYWALPTAAFIPSLVQSQLHQNSHETISSNGHCNPPLLTPQILQFGSAISSGLFGWIGISIDDISFDCYHSSLGAVWAKVEWNTTTVEADIFTANNISSLQFGPQQATQVSGKHVVGGPSPLPLSHDGTFLMFTAVNNLIPVAGTWDFWNAESYAPESVN